MWVIKTVLQAFAFFAVPLLILTMYNSITSRAKAIGIVVIQAYGPFFILVGLFYVAFGIFLWSPLPVRLFKLLLPDHLNG